MVDGGLEGCLYFGRRLFACDEFGCVGGLEFVLIGQLFQGVD